MVTRVCSFQEEDSPQSPEEEPTEEPENHDQAQPLRQNHAPQHHPAPRAEREWAGKLAREGGVGASGSVLMISFGLF